mmetsp:Transcript_18957/g.31418  ORF Transcript_18957/g.31418 Transcript_18957/m.31418 type:complete len:274 (+) Transcript_18957:143-964(+)|eukprot:CAMPEP_0119003384 /NCGR_PEP_ID=MMETSP1176-20130426/529_1 /TAXON_ID=265551 /ORGANISM="Synedropsis recta cf, Strain CCMP1620" /LENGTH=273 /DNA_ID=CAMNT_0006954983 /DNA_START=104 /DNA_END=925 /DNA_ORIENTATION=+
MTMTNSSNSSTTQELRRRTGMTSGTPVNDVNVDETESLSSKYYLGKGLSAPSMLKASPSHTGPVLKLHVPIFYTLLPAFLQRFLSYCFQSSSSRNKQSCWLTPSWKPRYLIQLGSYLYKFNDESSQAPKGSPLFVQELEVYLMDDLADVQGIDDYHSLAPTSKTDNTNYTYICVATLRKRHYYAVPSNEEAHVWVNTLWQARQEAITRTMGHAKHLPPYRYQYFDELAESLVQSKHRIRRKMQESTLREMELTTVGCMGGGSTGGPMPRGIYG